MDRYFAKWKTRGSELCKPFRMDTPQDEKQYCKLWETEILK